MKSSLRVMMLAAGVYCTAVFAQPGDQTTLIGIVGGGLLGLYVVTGDSPW